MADDQWAKKTIQKIVEDLRKAQTEREREGMARVQSMSDERHRGQAPTPTPGMKQDGPSDVAERYRALSSNDSETKGRTPGAVTRVDSSSRVELGELKPRETPQIQKSQQRGGRER